MGRVLKTKGSTLAARYAREVVAGKISAGAFVVQACQRHLDDLQRQKIKTFPFRFDSKKADKVCLFAENLVHVKGEWAGKPIRLEPFQAFIISSIFGWVRKRDGLRRFREAYIEIPRKNGKSVLAAVIGNYMFAADKEEGAEVYSGATTEKQAWEVFRPAKLMTERSPGYKSHFGIQVNAKNIHITKSGSRFEPIIGSPGDGASPSCAIVDEFHEHKTSVLYDTMMTGMGSRRQPLMFVITTAGTNLSGPCYDKRGHVIKVLAGQLNNEDLFGIIYTIDDKDDWEDFTIWKKANPCYGVSLYEDYLRKQYQDAVQMASKQNIIRCKHLNQWLNADTAWMNMVEWRKCADPSLRMDQFKSRPCWLGLDLSSKTDVAALMIVFKDDDGKTCAFGKYYLPEETIERPENQHYQTWRHQDLITETPGAIIDYSIIKDDIRELSKAFEVRRVGYDPFQATQLSTELASEGFPMFEVRPSVLSFSEPMKSLEALVLSQSIRFDGDPVLTWMMGNVVAHLDKKDNIYPNKERPENKIDGVIGLIMATDQMVRDRSEEPGIIII